MSQPTLCLRSIELIFEIECTCLILRDSAFLSVFQLKVPKLKVDVNRHKDGIANGKWDLGANIRFFLLARTHM